LYISAALYLYFTQDKKIFQRHYAKEHQLIFAKEVYFTTSDGIKLQGAYLENKKGAPLVLYFSGNANNVAEFIDTIAPKIKEYNFIGFNYPGYVKSEGYPSKENILKYAKEIFDRYKPDFVMGRSLGSAVASYVAYKKNPKGLVLITPIDSIESIAKKRYPIFPIKLLLKHNFDAVSYLKKLNIPVSVIVVENDDVVPNSSTQNVIKSIKNLKYLAVLKGIRHFNIYDYVKIDKVIKKALESL